MRFQIVKETFANETCHFYIKEKAFIGWRKIKTYRHYDSGEVIYYPTVEEAMAAVQYLIRSRMAVKVVDVEVVYDTGVLK